MLRRYPEDIHFKVFTLERRLKCPLMKSFQPFYFIYNSRVNLQVKFRLKSSADRVRPKPSRAIKSSLPEGTQIPRNSPTLDSRKAHGEIKPKPEKSVPPSKRP